MAEGVIPPPPWEEKAKEKGVPPPPWESTFSRIDELKATAPQGAVAKHAQTNLRNMALQRSAETQGREETQAYGRFASTMLKGGAVTAATLATGGLALGPALTLMGGVGLASSLAGTGIEEATGTHKSLKSRAVETAVDTALAPFGEGVGRGIGFVGKTLIPKLASETATQSTMGKALFENMYEETSQQLFSTVRQSVSKTGAVGNPTVNVGQPLTKFYQELENLPQGRGLFGRRFTPPTPKTAEVMGDVKEGLKAAAAKPKLEAGLTKAKELVEKTGFIKEGLQQEEVMGAADWADKLKSAIGSSQRAEALMAKLEAKLNTVNGQISTRQPLDALIEIKRSVQQFAYQEKTLGRLERPILKRLALGLDDSLRNAIAKTGPRAQEAADLYNKTNKIVMLQIKADAATDVARFLIKRTVMGGVGGFVGHEVGGTKGAEYGALAALAAPDISALVLGHIAAHPKAAVIMRGAVDAFMETGKVAPAVANQVLKLSGADKAIRQHVENYLSSQQNQQQPQ